MLPMTTTTVNAKIFLFYLHCITLSEKSSKFLCFFLQCGGHMASKKVHIHISAKKDWSSGTSFCTPILQITVIASAFKSNITANTNMPLFCLEMCSPGCTSADLASNSLKSECFTKSCNYGADTVRKIMCLNLYFVFFILRKKTRLF